MTEERRIKLVLEYDGTGYAGFQRQSHGVTIQGVLEEALASLCQESVAVVGAGRTDAGVHALGQVCHFNTRSTIPCANLMKGLNGILRPSIVVREAREVPKDFHARFSAINKVYAYFVLNRPYPSPLFHRYVLWVPRPLEEKRMDAACRFLIGEKDFSSFQASGGEEKNPVIEVKKAGCFRGAGDCPSPFNGTDDVITFRIEARSFLYRMVRNIMGTLLDVGEGKLEAGAIEEILRKRDRKAGGATAPAHGLFLVRVDYPERYP